MVAAVLRGSQPRGEGHAVAPAHGVAHQDDVLQLQGRAEAFQVFDIGLAGILAVGRPVAVSTPALIEGEDTVLIGRGLGKAVPRVPVTSQPVEGDQCWRRWIALFEIVELQAIDHHCSVDILRLHRHLLPPWLKVTERYAGVLPPLHGSSRALPPHLRVVDVAPQIAP